MIEENTITTIISESRDVSIPFEWMCGLESQWVQITLVDDRIVVHEPLNTEKE